MNHDVTLFEELFALNNQVAIVTGGLGRLGSEFTKTLARAGAHVAVFDIIDSPSEELLAFSGIFPVSFFKVDIRNEEEVSRAIDRVKKMWDTPTILVNNAGWRASPNVDVNGGVAFEKYPMDVWDDVFEINTKAAALMAKVVGKRMIEDNHNGVIINIASHYGVVSPDQRIYAYREASGKNAFIKDPSYGASKAALIALTRDLATQWAPQGIRVVALVPGGVHNPDSDQAFIDNYNNHVPMGRMAELHEYNGALLFLASRASSYMTGTSLIIDGGYTIW